ncbi:heavy metal-binding domain-containing protein [Rufibacter roseus]|uniref:Heavy metal-binding domain-containing protein n=1 Tax=Rufibacter roseus TaxID=1567108 RepID=A0ABW2DKD3_9BACT|nr:heavy metal-binding domain-containing protein [Rufibacter roseus]
MKKIKLNVAVAFFGLTLFTACNSGGTEQNATTTEQAGTTEQVAGVTYTCPMHPEVVSNEPGKCPKCGMFLEKVEAGASQDSTAQHQHEAGDQH